MNKFIYLTVALAGLTLAACTTTSGATEGICTPYLEALTDPPTREQREALFDCRQERMRNAPNRDECNDLYLTYTFPPTAEQNAAFRACVEAR